MFIITELYDMSLVCPYSALGSKLPKQIRPWHHNDWLKSPPWRRRKVVSVVRIAL